MTTIDVTPTVEPKHWLTAVARPWRRLNGLATALVIADILPATGFALGLAMAIGAGMTSAITNPLHDPEMQGIMGGNVVMGHDPHCTRWIRKFREPVAEGAEGAGRRDREGRRRRRE